jgi:hypothetical protein
MCIPRAFPRRKLQKCAYSLCHACQPVRNHRRIAEWVFIDQGIREFDIFQM